MDGVPMVFHTGSFSGAPVEQAAAREVLDELFTHSDGVSDKFFAELLQTGVHLPTPPVRVVTIAPGHRAERFSMEFARRFAVDMSGKLPERIHADGVFFYLNSCVQGVVAVPSAEALQDLYDGLYRLVTAYDPHARPHAAISSACSKIEDISHGCDENQQAHQYERFLTQAIDVIVQPQDGFLYGIEAQQEEDDDAFFGHISQRICNAITVEDRALLHRTLDEALNYMVNRFPRVSGIHMRAIHFCKPLEMTLVGADLIDRLFVQQFRLVQRVIETENEAELRESFHRQMDAIADYAAQRKQMHQTELMHRVMEFIDENLSDCMLSLPTIAQSFNMAPARLSAEFRQHYQVSVPEAIHQRRVQYLKQQLVTSSKPVRELALDAGYVSVATMNRAFLRLEGVYPGQYRKKYRAAKPD